MREREGKSSRIETKKKKTPKRMLDIRVSECAFVCINGWLKLKRLPSS